MKYAFQLDSQIQFRSVRCTDIVDDEEAGTTVSFLRADTNIDCMGEKHKSFLRIIIPLILVYQLIPVMYFALLYRVRNKLNPQDIDETAALRVVQSNRTDPEVIPLRFLFKGYSKEYWYWECIEAYRRMLFIRYRNCHDFHSVFLTHEQ